MSNQNEVGQNQLKAPRVDPTYQEQYTAPVEETRSFWSRFWWLIPALLLLIALPFILRGCNESNAGAIQITRLAFAEITDKTDILLN
jgi:hypothetical protein